MVGKTAQELCPDDDRIRRVAARALEAAGYTVLLAGRPIHLLVTDVVMPHMDGRSLAEALQSQDGKLRVLYTSGYTDDAIVRYGVQRADVAFLRKPYTLEALRTKVREVLDAAD